MQTESVGFPLNFGKKSYKSNKDVINGSGSSFLTPITVDNLKLGDNTNINSMRLASLTDYMFCQKALYSRGGVEESNIDMIYELVRANKLTPRALMSFSVKDKLSSNAECDLDKLYNAYCNNRNIENEFVPKFKSEDDALNEINEGDICRIENEKYIRIKTNDTLEEIFLTPKTCLELFPPFERYCYNQSATTGDCYLIAGLDAFYSNPKTRNKVLEVFKEDENGRVSLAFGGWEKKNDEIVKKEKNNFEIKNLEAELGREDLTRFSLSCEGARAIELLVLKDTENNAQNRIENEHKKYLEIYNSMGENDTYIENDIGYDKENIEWFLDAIEESKTNTTDRDKKIISFCDAFEDWPAEMPFNGILPIEYFKGSWIYDLLQKVKNPYIEGGNFTNVAERLGLNAKRVDIKKNSNFFKNICLSNFDNEGILFNAYADKPGKETGIIPGHEYCIVPFEDNGQTKVAVRNPHNSSRERIFSAEDFINIFDGIYVGWED